MVIDSSAVVAILLDEPESAGLLEAMQRDPIRQISAATYVELVMVLEGRRPGIGVEIDRFLEDVRVEVVAFTAEHAAAARTAWHRFGRGRHAAALNLGDCFSYATAQLAREPLLYKGDDFAKTDIRSAS